MSKGGMQSQSLNQTYCRCGKPISTITSYIIDNEFIEVVMHIGKGIKPMYHTCYGRYGFKRSFTRPDYESLKKDLKELKIIDRINNA